MIILFINSLIRFFVVNIKVFIINYLNAIILNERLM